MKALWRLLTRRLRRRGELIDAHDRSRMAVSEWPPGTLISGAPLPRSLERLLKGGASGELWQLLPPE